MHSSLFERTSESYSNKIPTLAGITNLSTSPGEYGVLALEPQRLKTAAYARVSTESEMQGNSLENQIIYYTNYIRSKPEYQFVGVYSDRGKTGTRLESRPGFKKLIRDALDGKIELILCKSISRFARNVVDTVETVRKLKDNGIRVIFEQERIDTADIQSETLLVLIGAVAQEESRSISKNVIWANSRRFEKGEVKFTRMLGYTKNKNGEWTIVEEEAKIVREAFNEYLNGNSPSQIAKMFILKGYKKANGRKDWSAIAVRDILRNERYTGDAYCQKTYTKDYLSHKRVINNGERNKYLIKNHHEPIIDHSTFNRVQEMFTKNMKKVINIPSQRKTYPLSKRIECGNCGANFQRFICRGKVTWRCGNQGKSNLLCQMKGIKEEAILEALSAAFYKKYKLGTKDKDTDLIFKMIRDIKSSISTREFQQKQLRLELERALIEENKAIINPQGEDLNILKGRRIDIENRILQNELWWNLFDEDDEYRNSALEFLENMKSLDYLNKDFKKKIKNIIFFRAWVVRIKVLSPILISITWLNGEETKAKLKG